MTSLEVETTNHRTFQMLLHNVEEQLKLKPGTSGQYRHIWPTEYRLAAGQANTSSVR